MIEFKTSKGAFVAIKIPNECHISQISVGGGDIDTAIGYPDGKYEPLGINYYLICKLSEATEDDAKLIVDECKSHPKYWNYNINYYREFNALHSLHALLKSKGIDIDSGNWYLFKKI